MVGFALTFYAASLFVNVNNLKKIRARLLQDQSRWIRGETVHEFYKFEPNDPVAGWDGTHRGQALNPAVFFWVAEIEFIDTLFDKRW